MESGFFIEVDPQSPEISLSKRAAVVSKILKPKYRMRMSLTLVLLLALFSPRVSGAYVPADTRQSADSVAVFCFQADSDDFYAAFGNGEKLKRLYALAGQYKDELSRGIVLISVDGYSSHAGEREALQIARVRSNRVKSMLITEAGMKEAYFVTKNHASDYAGLKDVVVVRIPVRRDGEAAAPAPAPKAEAKPAPAPKPAARHEPGPEPKPAASAAQQTAAEPAPVAATAKTKRCAVDLRTNLLYDAFLVPTLGVEWHVSPGFGIKLDGSWSGWGDEHGSVQKIWLVCPEVRWYRGVSKRWYLGVGANAGRYNVYGGMIGNFFPDKTGYRGYEGPVGYQGTLYGLGITGGYRMPLTGRLWLDLNLGLGYTRFEYDSFNIIEQTRVYNAKNVRTNFFGPTQAGVTLVWRIGAEK